MRDIANLREDYNQAHLMEKDALDNPMDMFSKWFDEARNSSVKEPNAMILSTVNKDNVPYSRTVLMKGLSQKGIIFYSNYKSRKAQQIESNNIVSLLFLWKEEERQVQIIGKALKTDLETTQKYFNSRPRGSQIGAWTSPQSSKLKNRKELDDLQAQFAEKYKNTETIPVPDFWGGYIIEPLEVEFWQGRTSRLHDRLLYKLDDNENWIIQRLAP